MPERTRAGREFRHPETLAVRVRCTLLMLGPMHERPDSSAAHASPHARLGPRWCAHTGSWWVILAPFAVRSDVVLVDASPRHDIALAFSHRDGGAAPHASRLPGSLAPRAVGWSAWVGSGGHRCPILLTPASGARCAPRASPPLGHGLATAASRSGAGTARPAARDPLALAPSRPDRHPHDPLLAHGPGGCRFTSPHPQRCDS